jgi:phage shock protein A
MDDTLKQRLVEALGSEVAENIKLCSSIAKIEPFEASAHETVYDLLKLAFDKGQSFPGIRIAGANGAIGPNNKPRMLKISAWIAHAGQVNMNRYRFIAEDLKEVVDEGLFGAPYFGMLDYNHDFQLYGVWYSAKYAYDPVAEADGILAEGVLFAWRFESLADKMLAEQVRNGSIAVSMGCHPQFIEFHEDDRGEFIDLRKPVFVTTSVLDIAPADQFGRGLGTEDTEQLPEERELLLQIAQAAASASNEPKEVEMTPEQIAELVTAMRDAVKEENQAQFGPLFEAAERLPNVEGELATANESLTAATTRVAELEGTVSGLETERDEIRVAREAAETRIAELEAELTELREFRTQVETERASAELKATRDARLAELSEPALAAFNRMEEEARERLASRWEAMDQDEWSIALASLNGTNRYETASAREGLLPGAKDGEGAPKFEIDRFVK